MTNVCYKCKEPLNNNPKPKHGLHASCFREWFNLDDEEEDFQNLHFEKTPQESNSLKFTSFFHGRFKKYSSDLSGEKYILKMCDEYPELAKTEYICNQIATLVGLDIPKNYLLYFQGQQDCFVTYNFMQDFSPANLEHAWRFLKESDQYNLKTLLTVVENNTGRLTEIKKFIKMCLFDALVGNHDRHGRNFAFISTPHGYSFAPCYDNPSYFGIAEYLAATHAPRCAIQTSCVSEPMMKDYVEELIQLGFREEVESFKKGLSIEKVKLLINQSLLTEERKNAFLRFVETSYQVLNNAL